MSLFDKPSGFVERRQLRRVDFQQSEIVFAAFGDGGCGELAPVGHHDIQVAAERGRFGDDPAVGADDAAESEMLAVALDADGCIGQLDLDFFMSQFNSTNIGQADITGDGVIDAADFAILAGNYENNCPAIEPTPTVNSLPVLPIPSSTVVADAILETPIQVPTDVELTLSPHFAPTLVINLTETLSFESTPEET